MQFYLNGFKLGDPEVFEAAVPSPSDTVLEEVDVLIIGCGPAGLTLATQLAMFPDIKTRIVDKKPEPLQLGQADGIACRTMEMFQAFGFAGQVLKEAYWVNETSFWRPDDYQPNNIVRSGVVQDTEDGLSEFPHVTLSQARVHEFYLRTMRNSPTRLEPNYSRRFIYLEINNAESSIYPVTVQLERTDAEHAGQVEIVKARYVVGCDGAQSSVRQSIDREMRRDSANQIWGVLEGLVVSDFPDLRKKAVIQSAAEGNIVLIPREGGYLVRIYVELDAINENKKVAKRDITADHIIVAAQRILKPYTFEVKEIVWWSVYEIAQGLCDKFDDGKEEGDEMNTPHVFIVGDACHTHSPKAGQGMNVSMQDSFNLGWKLASVLRGLSTPSLLHTYSAERHAVANELIEFDREWASMLNAPLNITMEAHEEGVDPAEVQKFFVQKGRYTAGTATRYTPSILTGEPTYQHLAEGFLIGMRFHSAPVIRLADAKPMHLGHVVEADGRWRLFAFSKWEEITADSDISRLCNYLVDSTDSPIRRYTKPDNDIDSVIDVRVIYQQDHRDLELKTIPSLLLPRKGRYGLYDYEKVFCPDLKGSNDIFDMRGIDRNKGCMIIVRPDQYIAQILPLGAYTELSSFFDGFMIQKN